MNRLCLIYVRISQDRAGAGLGVARQEDDCRALAASLGWDVLEVLVDNDVSASTGRVRPGYSRLLDALRAGRAAAVIAWHTDRLHRSPSELETYLDVCEKNGVTTHTVKAGPLDLATPSGRAVARTLGAWARFEVEHKADRTRRAQEQAALAGRWLGGTRPFGWESAADRPALVDREAEAIRRGSADLLAGHSLSSIAKAWNGDGLTSTLGHRFVPTTVRQVLLRARNAGLATWKGEVVGPSTFPAIVDEETWRAVVALLRAPDRPGAGTDTRARHLVAGIARCHCGAFVRSATATGRRPEDKRTVYRCHMTGRGHVGKDARKVDDLVTDAIVDRLARPDAIELVAPGAETRDLGLEAATLRTRLDDLVGSYARGMVTLAQLEAGSAAIRENLQRTEQEMTMRVRTPALVPMLEAPDGVEDGWSRASLEERRSVVRALMHVTLLPADKTRRRAFDPATVRMDWRDLA